MKVDDNSQTPALITEGFKDGTNMGNDYIYDDNGNLITDLNKDITNIDYNHFNLPETVNANGSQTGTITYVYDAVGTKLKKTLTENGTSHTTKYANGYIYLDDELQFFSHPEGYTKPVSGTSESVKGSKGGQTTQSGYQYVFQYKDHLGNVRLSYADGDLNGSVSNSEIIEESHYYPFGLKQKGYNTTISGGNSLAQRWKYNGIELNEDLSLNLYEMEVRQYDPTIGRWTSIDPVIHFDYSPYNAFDNNPIYWADPSGANAGLANAAMQHSGRGATAANTINPIDAEKKKKEEEGEEEENNSANNSSNNNNSKDDASNTGINASGLNAGKDCDDCPNPTLFKNGEIIVVNNVSYMLFIDNWIVIESQEEYEKRVKEALEELKDLDLTDDIEYKYKLLKAYSHRGAPYEKSSKPLVEAMKGALGLGAPAKATKTLYLNGNKSLTPWSIVVGAIVGYAKGRLDIMKKMELHDENVDSLREEGYFPKIEYKHYNELYFNY
ncbi:RHS repeat domain-containing protein [Aureisphaera galaxeae]|uniref:RHS repeat domain-containing protein n=1 Tax=Aureisphaera galaxeae TaxID=1538023 RepID=UPI003AF320FD